MAKSLLNNLFGRFGIGLEKSVTKIVDAAAAAAAAAAAESTFDKMSLVYKIVSYKTLVDEMILVTYRNCY